MSSCRGQGALPLDEDDEDDGGDDGGEDGEDGDMGVGVGMDAHPLGHSTFRSTSLQAKGSPVPTNLYPVTEGVGRNESESDGGEVGEAHAATSPRGKR